MKESVYVEKRPSFITWELQKETRAERKGRHNVISEFTVLYLVG